MLINPTISGRDGRDGQHGAPGPRGIVVLVDKYKKLLIFFYMY